MSRERLYKDAKRVAERIRSARNVLVVTHIDADGITAGAVASSALEMLGTEHAITFNKKLDGDTIEDIRDRNPELVWFTDLGSGNLDLLDGLDVVISDHHVLSKKSSKPKDRGNILSYCDDASDIPQVNPHLAGLDGARDLSGAGTSYLVARELDKGNIDLSALAAVGAVGDLQDTEALRLTGTNRDVLDDGRTAGVLDWQKDIRYFGRETRPVFKMLQYSSDPIVPGITGSQEASIEVLAELGIPLKVEENWRSWADLNKGERKRVISYLMQTVLKKGLGHKLAKRMVGEVYTLVKEKPCTELRDAKEYATLLNSCGRHGKAEIGYKVCMGDRDEWLDKARLLLSGHRRSLVEALRYVEEMGVTELEWLQYFDGEDKIPDTIVGTIAGMLLNSGNVSRKKPMFGFAQVAEEGKVKVSARGTRGLIEAGLDLSKVMNVASKELGGRGGGHNIAAGASIPKGTESEFLEKAQGIIRSQLSG